MCTSAHVNDTGGWGNISQVVNGEETYGTSVAYNVALCYASSSRQTNDGEKSSERKGRREEEDLGDGGRGTGLRRGIPQSFMCPIMSPKKVIIMQENIVV